MTLVSSENLAAQLKEITQIEIDYTAVTAAHIDSLKKHCGFSNPHDSIHFPIHNLQDQDGCGIEDTIPPILARPFAYTHNGTPYAVVPVYGQAYNPVVRRYQGARKVIKLVYKFFSHVDVVDEKNCEEVAKRNWFWTEISTREYLRGLSLSDILYNGSVKRTQVNINPNLVGNFMFQRGCPVLEHEPMDFQIIIESEVLSHEINSKIMVESSELIPSVLDLLSKPNYATKLSGADVPLKERHKYKLGVINDVHSVNTDGKLGNCAMYGFVSTERLGGHGKTMISIEFTEVHNFIAPATIGISNVEDHVERFLKLDGSRRSITILPTPNGNALPTLEVDMDVMEVIDVDDLLVNPHKYNTNYICKDLTYGLRKHYFTFMLLSDKNA